MVSRADLAVGSRGYFLFWAACAAYSADAPMPLNKVGAAKLIIGDVKENQTYFEHMFGMKEIDRYSDQLYDEPIMAFDEGAKSVRVEYDASRLTEAVRSNRDSHPNSRSKWKPLPPTAALASGPIAPSALIA